MLGILLAFLSAVLAGYTITLVRRKLAESNPFSITVILCLMGNIIFLPLAIVFTNYRMINLEAIAFFAVAGVLAPGIARLFYYRGMEAVGAPVNASIFGIYPMFSSIFAVLVLNEAFSLVNWIGICVILIGVVSIQSSNKKEAGSKRFSMKSLSLPLVAGLAIAASYILRKNGLNVYNEPLLGLAIGYAFSALVYSLLLISKNWRSLLFLKRDFQSFWKAGVGFSLGWLLSFYAVSYEKVSVVVPVLQLQPLFVIFFAYLYLRELEHLSHRIILSSILIVIGVILVIS